MSGGGVLSGKKYVWMAVGTPVNYHAVIGEGPTMQTRISHEPWLLSGHAWVVMLEDKSGCVACAAVSPRGILKTEPLTWKDPNILPPPDDTAPGHVLIGWIFCHKGVEFWAALHRKDGAWMLDGDRPVPSHTPVVAWADPPQGPGSGLRQHGEAS